MLRTLLVRIAWLMALLTAGPADPAPLLPVHEISLAAKKFTYEPETVKVTAGEPVRLVIHSADTTHGFAIRELKIKLEVPRSGDAVVAEFVAPPPGRYEIACSEVCGRGHRQMKASLVSVASTPALPAR